MGWEFADILSPVATLSILFAGGVVRRKIREETSLKRLSTCDFLDQGAVTMTAFPYTANSRTERLVVILVRRFVQFFS